MNKIKLNLHCSLDPTNVIDDGDFEWMLTVDGKPYPCESKCIMSYEDAIKMIRMAEAIEGTADD